MNQIVTLQGAFNGEPGSPEAARYSQLIETWADALRLDWPVRYNGRRLAMVIRQWVEEEPSAYVAEELRSSDEWNGLVIGARKIGYFRDMASPLDTSAMIHSAGIHLERAGLPSNPATARHFIASVNEQAEPLPARGVLVTTLCYMTRPFSAELGQPARIRFMHPSETIISGVTQWMPGPLLARVNAVIRRHETFMEENEAAPYAPTSTDASYRARRHRQDEERVPSLSPLDYIESAVHSICTSSLRPTHPDDVRFIKACDRSYRATRGRIQRHNRKHPHATISLTPPANWRTIVLEQMRQLDCHAAGITET